MDRQTLIFILLMSCVAAISWWRINKKTTADLVTPQDKLTAKGCIQIAVQILGIAFEPGAKSPSDEIAAGQRSVRDQGSSCAVVVNALTMGLISGYVERQKLSIERTQALTLHASTVVATGFGLNPENIWDRTGELTKENGPILFLFQKASKSGVSLPDEVRESLVLTDQLKAAVKQADGGLRTSHF